MTDDPRAPVLRSSINPLSPRCPRCGLSHIVWYESMQRRVCPCVIAFDEANKWRWEPKATQETTLFGAR